MTEQLQVVAGHDAGHPPTARDVAAVFFRHQKLFAMSFAIVALAGTMYAVLVPSYKAEMKVLVRRGRIDPAVTPTQTAAPAFEHDEVSEEELNSEVELLRDEDILRKVVINMGLADRSPWFSKLRGENRETRIEESVQRLGAMLDVQPVRKSRLITISYKSSDARVSAAVLRSLADAYLAKHAEIRRPSGQQTFFEVQMKQSRQALEQAQAQLIDFTRNRRVVSAELERDLTLQKLSDAESSERGLQASIAEAAERARSLGAKLSTLPERRVVQIKNADNPQLQERLKSKLLELELKRTELLTKFQPSYRLVQEVDQQIAQAKGAIETEDLKPLRDETTEQDPEYQWAHSEHLKSQIEMRSLQERQAVARTQVLEYRTAAQKFGESAITQRDLERQLKTAEEKYLLYVNKREEARIGDALDENGILNVAIAEPPRVPNLPLWPLWTATCLSLVGAGVFSTGLVFAADYFDPSLRTPEDVLKVLGMPVLASLPVRVEPPQRRLRES
jgi:protein tyrosine kinase modulator